MSGSGRKLRRVSIATCVLVLQVTSVMFAPAASAKPVISSFDPTAGPVGTEVTITGSGFVGTKKVLFNGVEATFSVVSGTTITTIVPTGATDGTIRVRVAKQGVATSSTAFDVTPQGPPTVTSFSPPSGWTGESVVVTGTNFTGATTVTFGGTGATFVINSPTQITTVVPNGASDGPIAVTTQFGTGTSPTNFDVVPQPAPVINGFTPTTGPIATQVTITGNYFTGATSVRFAGISATFAVNSSTQITATVPAGATTGTISVTTATGTATSASNFTVTFDAPEVNSFSPSHGPVGSEVTIQGDFFTGATNVTFGAVQATFRVESPTRIVATVPVDAVDAPITVMNVNGSDTSSTDFIVQTVVGRTVSLTLTGHLRAKGQVSAAGNTAACEVGVNVKILRRRDGAWRVLKVITTGDNGTFATNLRDRRGRYRAAVPKIDTPSLLCRWVRSSRQVHRH